MTAAHIPSPQQAQRYYAGLAAIVLAAFAGGLVLLYQVLEQGPVGAWRVVDVVCGAMACLGLLLSRRSPVVVGVVLAGTAAVVASAGIANMVALYFVARSRSLRVTLAVAATDVAAGWVFSLVYPGNVDLSATLTVNIAIAAAVTAWGALRQSQRALLDSYRERAERAEQEQSLREEHIRVTERTRIAREMHDVVAHRISLIALHAGGLEVAREHGPDDVRTTAGLIRGSAVQALDELRSTIGVLRAGELPSLEQPGFDRIDDLVREARDAGQPVDLIVDPDIDPDLAPGPGRDLYRIVQEGLTNARKHAPGQRVRISLRRAGDELEVQMLNAHTSHSLGVPGSSSGLIGLLERAALAGGSLTHEVTPEGDFELRARLPWR